MSTTTTMETKAKQISLYLHRGRVLWSDSPGAVPRAGGPVIADFSESEVAMIGAAEEIRKIVDRMLAFRFHEAALRLPRDPGDPMPYFVRFPDRGEPVAWLEGMDYPGPNPTPVRGRTFRVMARTEDEAILNALAMR